MERPYKRCDCGHEMTAQVVNKQIDYPDIPVVGDNFIMLDKDGMQLCRPMQDFERADWRNKVHLLRHLEKAQPGDVLYICDNCGKAQRPELKVEGDKNCIKINKVLLDVVHNPPFINDEIRWNGIEPQEVVGKIPALTEQERQKVQEILDWREQQSELALDRHRHSILETLTA